MLYGFSELIKYLSLPGPSFEQPGTDQPESAVGADHDQDGPTLCSGSTLANRFATGTGTGAAAADAVVADDAAVADGAGWQTVRPVGQRVATGYRVQADDIAAPPPSPSPLPPPASPPGPEGRPPDETTGVMPPSTPPHPSPPAAGKGSSPSLLALRRSRGWPCGWVQGTGYRESIWERRRGRREGELALRWRVSIPAPLG